MASTCGQCGTKHKPGECPMAGGSPGKKRGRRILGNLSKGAADSWIEKMGDEVEGESVTGKPKKRHYEKIPDPENPGRFILILVED